MTTATAPAPAPANGTKPQRSLSIRDRLDSDAFKAEIARILPKHLTPDRMARVAITAIMRTPQLADCDQASFFQAMMQLSQWGLEPDGRRAHLIPFKNNKRGVIEVQLIIDYKGLVELLMRTGNVSKIHADIVCEHDEFEYDRGEILKHKIDLKRPRGTMYAAYCIVRLKDGTEKCEAMSSDEIEAIRKRSRAGSSGPWVTDFAEMAKKTVFRRVAKWLPLSAEVRDALLSDDDVIDVPSRPAVAGDGNMLSLPASPSKSDQLANRLRGQSQPESGPESEPESHEPTVEAEPPQPLPAPEVPTELEAACADAYENGDLGAIAKLDERWFGPDANWTEDPKQFKAARDLFEYWRDKLKASPKVKAASKSQSSLV